MAVKQSGQFRPHTHKRYANQLKGDSNSAKEFEHGTWTL